MPKLRTMDSCSSQLMSYTLPTGLTACITAMAVSLASGSVLAGSVAETATNPVGNLLQYQVIDQIGVENYNSDGPSNAVIYQPVIPVKLPFARAPLMITRTTVPGFVTTPDLGPSIGRVDGFGDITFLGLVLPKMDIEGVTIGIGPTVTLPTATSKFTGSGKWEAGPAFFYINTQIPKFQFGLFTFQEWSFAGGSSRDDTSKLSLQPFFTQHFDGGWYAGSQDIPWTYNFKTDKWTMPMGPKVGRVMKFGDQPVNVSAAAYYSPFDDGPSEKWTARLNITFLFPE
jgi:hypothetical protein